MIAGDGASVPPAFHIPGEHRHQIAVGQIWVPHARIGIAFAAGDEQVGVGLQRLAGKPAHQGRLALAGPTGDKDGTPLTVIGTDGGLLERPLEKEYITLAPAQRIELWVDFSERAVGEQFRLVNLPSAAPDGVAFPVLDVEVARAERVSLALPEQLTTITPHDESKAVNPKSPREFALSMGMGMIWTLNGRTFEMESVARDEVVKLGDLEVWEFSNQAGGGMGMMGGMALPHPMHVHGLQFQILEREIDSANRAAWETLSEGFVDEGWHDTVLVSPGERVKILLKFEDFEGLYLYHCHNLEHEDMGMMRNYRVEA